MKLSGHRCIFDSNLNEKSEKILDASNVELNDENIINLETSLIFNR